MNYEMLRNTINNINDIIIDVNNIVITTPRKNGHFAQLEVIRKTMTTIAEKLNDTLYLPDYNAAFCEYNTNIKMNVTKKELDKNLNYCKISLLNDLNRHRNFIYNEIEKMN